MACRRGIITLLLMVITATLLVLTISDIPDSNVIINEISTHSATGSQDATDENGNLCDWVELYNPSDYPVNLAGWGLSDNKDDLFKAQLTASFVVPAHGYLVITCS